MWECYCCGEKAVIWDADFSFEDYGFDGDGIVQTFHCMNCGAEIEYIVAEKEDEDGIEN